MPGLRVWQDCEYASVTLGAEYALISLNMIEYTDKFLKKTVLNMPEFGMCLMQYIA